MNAELWIDVDSVYFNYSLNRGDTGFLALGVIRFVFIDSPGCHYLERNERVLSMAPICTPCPGCQHGQRDGAAHPGQPTPRRLGHREPRKHAGDPPRPWLYPSLTPSLFLSPVPIDATKGLKMLYVFVDIKIDASHFLETIRFNFAAGTSLALVSTIQFVSTLQVRWELPAVQGVGWGSCLPQPQLWLSLSLPHSGRPGVLVVPVLLRRAAAIICCCRNVDQVLYNNSDQCFMAAPLPGSPGSCSVNVRAGGGALGILMQCRQRQGKLRRVRLSAPERPAGQDGRR